jgi:hypothetical protein
VGEVTYDSRQDTVQHILAVRARIDKARDNLRKRGYRHDRSKLESPEKEVFDVVTPRLKDSTYGSDEYKGFLAEMDPALEHHYAHNSHHPEHYEDGIAGMSLLDLLEMLCDWKAATERHADGSMARSMEVNVPRFGISEQLERVLENTIREMGF